MRRLEVEHRNEKHYLCCSIKQKAGTAFHLPLQDSPLATSFQAGSKTYTRRLSQGLRGEARRKLFLQEFLAIEFAWPDRLEPDEVDFKQAQEEARTVFLSKRLSCTGNSKQS